jgi:hypothetical protein
MICFSGEVMLTPEGLARVKHPPAVYGALLKDHYVMDTLHFHWGLRDYRGSEHRVNGVRSVNQTASVQVSSVKCQNIIINTIIIIFMD